jgi:hypothetical protein
VVIHPRAFRTPKQPKDDYQDRLVELMNLLSKKEFGCPAALLPVQYHEVILNTVEFYLREREQAEQEGGMAS